MTVVDVAGWADRAMALIRDDITAGQVPATVSTFSGLHDYVDANQYVDETAPTAPDGCDLAGDAWLAACNAVSDEVNRRLQAAHNQGGTTMNDQDLFDQWMQGARDLGFAPKTAELTIADIDEWLGLVNASSTGAGWFPHEPYRKALGDLVGQELPRRRYSREELQILLARARKALSGS